MLDYKFSSVDFFITPFNYLKKIDVGVGGCGVKVS